MYDPRNVYIFCDWITDIRETIQEQSQDVTNTTRILSYQAGRRRARIYMKELQLWFHPHIFIFTSFLFSQARGGGGGGGGSRATQYRPFLVWFDPAHSSRMPINKLVKPRQNCLHFANVVQVVLYNILLTIDQRKECTFERGLNHVTHVNILVFGCLSWRTRNARNCGFSSVHWRWRKSWIFQHWLT